MPKHILVVDDSKEVANTKVWVIQKMGEGKFTAEAVYGGPACLERLNQTPPIDLILLDMDMPIINGADVIRSIIKNESPQVRILPMTAWGPGWIQHWNLSELAESKLFKEWVYAETYDKATDAEEMMELIDHALV